jgi:hypothetical protein
MDPSQMDLLLSPLMLGLLPQVLGQEQVLARVQVQVQHEVLPLVLLLVQAQGQEPGWLLVLAVLQQLVCSPLLRVLQQEWQVQQLEQVLVQVLVQGLVQGLVPLHVGTQPSW